MEHAFSQRTQQRDAFIQRYRNTFGKEPDKNRIADFIREGKKAATKRFKEEYHQAYGKRPNQALTNDFVQDWRSAKLKEVPTQDVRRLQQSRLTLTQQQALAQAVTTAQSTSPLNQRPTAKLQKPSSAYNSNQQSNPSHTQEPRPPKQTKRSRPARKASRHQSNALRNYRLTLAIQSALRGRPHSIIRSTMRRAMAKR